MASQRFHPAVATWFSDSFAEPTACQQRAWRALAARRHTLVAAPTGSGKTLAAFLTAIDDLVRLALAERLDDSVHVLYVSPLKALSNDIQRNLESPLAGVRERLRAAGAPDIVIRAAVRTGDTPQAVRALMRRRPPHILVTTPESLYILLSSESGRDMLAAVRSVIVDEIHALAGNKRGAHLSLSLARLDALAASPPVRIGLSATQRPIEDIARFLVGSAAAPCEMVDEGHVRPRDLAIELPSAPLETVLSGESANEIYDRVATLIGEHRTTLVFVNTRRMAERVAKVLSDRLGTDAVTSHHGSMAKERRLDAEQRLKAGTLKALVATASLELGIDVGEVDLVCQLGTTRSLAVLLQRVGRSGHAVGAVAKGRLFPQTRDELVECAALLDMTRRGELDALNVAGPALDVLAQQIVAETACRDLALDELYALVRTAYPYRALPRADFDQVIAMLAEGYGLAHGRRAAYLHLDAVNGMVRARRGARLVAVTCGGAIPDTADYDVIVEPHGTRVGTVNEDFAIESLPGDVFQLGNTAWRLLRVEAAALRVEDATGQPPSIPFWLGEAPARSAELSQAVARIRADFASRLDASAATDSDDNLVRWFAHEIGTGRAAARQLVDYLLAGCRALGAMPTQDTLILERFFDESGGMQLVLHAPFGSRVNRAWGLALRKRFCRQFNFELQAAAVEDAIVISLGAVHSFPLEDVWRFLHADTVRDVLTQALLDAPMFTVRWRWVASCALALQRFRGGRKVPPRLVRMQAEDLVALVFPDQLACAENLQGRRAIPDHPLVRQTIADCLQEAMDCNALEALLRAMAAGRKRLLARDLTEPSPFAHGVLNANPYAFLDDAPLEERRTLAVQARRWLDPAQASDLGALDARAIERVRDEVWPVPQNVEELHDALLSLGVLADITEDDRATGGRRRFGAPVRTWLDALCEARRASQIAIGERRWWVCTERYGEIRQAFPGATLVRGAGEILATQPASREDALAAVVRGQLDLRGPVTIGDLLDVLPSTGGAIAQALAAIEAGGSALRGQYTPGAPAPEWCDRRLLARIHRYTLERLRAEIEPVPSAAFLRFLLGWQFLAAGAQVEGAATLRKVVEMLAGFEAPAGAWESALLPGRIADYTADYLDQAVASGRIAWLRLGLREAFGRGGGPLLSTPIALVPRNELGAWLASATPDADPMPSLGGAAQRLHATLSARGASFFEDLVAASGLLRTQVESALGELVAAGLVTADSFAGLRALLTPTARRRPLGGARRRHVAACGIEDAGRWQLVPRAAAPAANAGAETIARTLLRRYGVVFRRLLERETRCPPWRDLLPVLRTLEARGEVRGGRFVAGFSGEQFALPEALEGLRRARHAQDQRQCIAVSAADPLNLVGIVVPGLRIPATAANRVAYLNGEAVAVRVAGEVRFLKSLSSEDEIRARTALAGSLVPRPLRAYLRR